MSKVSLKELAGSQDPASFFSLDSDVEYENRVAQEIIQRAHREILSLVSKPLGQKIENNKRRDIRVWKRIASQEGVNPAKNFSEVRDNLKIIFPNATIVQKIDGASRSNDWSYHTSWHQHTYDYIWFCKDFPDEVSRTCEHRTSLIRRETTHPDRFLLGSLFQRAEQDINRVGDLEALFVVARYIEKYGEDEQSRQWASKVAPVAFDLIGQVAFLGVERRMFHSKRGRHRHGYDTYRHLSRIDKIFIQVFPADVKRDDQGRLHCLDGPAVRFQGQNHYIIHGVQVEPWIVKHPERISFNDIFSQSNAEVRRVMLEIADVKKLRADSRVRHRQKDKFGELIDVNFSPNFHPARFVLVKNSSPEPDGTYKDYLLGCPRHCSSAHEAVAWTFGLTKEEYNPVFES